MVGAKAFQLSADSLGTELLTNHVSPKRKTFRVHKKLLCDRSEFFRKLSMEVTKRITETVMYLPVDDADAFDSLIIYIYQNLLPAFPTEKHPATKEGSAKYYEEIIYPLLVLAEKLSLNIWPTV
ncbi:uncharacterized protein RAG0_15354 [Rhynchosporium agropyri]|uniref:BTB domain-containing protein n=1 Tax=Rhynchosporium agropyri TaxID=914238 RepID=A0A1E1LKT4_9HELO|nr:uncharacterized protein RAG0_15354 [Rhynchosporium agropyri]